jgi:aspartyl-tRNA(Asn)/glutamyl-tRNA(Gln) amidotransferase subunit A
MDDAADLAIPEAGVRLRSGALTSAALTEAHLCRIAARDPTYRAFVTVSADRARADAARADAELATGLDRGPLHGIPVALKDLIETAGIRTTGGSRLREAHVPTGDATIVRRLGQAGAVLLGKLATYELATVGPDSETPFPPARNPWNLGHITGGSSSGSAAAVAGGLIRTSVGSDTAGSIRAPASYCGVVGLKPTFGAVPLDGVLPLSPSLDTLGPVSASVAEAAITFDAMTGRSAAESTARLLGTGLLGTDLHGMRIGYARAWFASDPALEPEVLEAIDAAASQLSLLGAIVREAALPDYQRFEDAASKVLNAESYAVHRDDLAARWNDYGPMSRASLLLGSQLGESEVSQARAEGDALRGAVTEALAPFAALITVCTLGTALPLESLKDGSTVWTPMRTMGFNLTGHPVLVLPVGFARGLPIGMQIVGRHHEEAVLFRIGHAFEQSTDYSGQRPPRLVPEAIPA